jgi:hypothetical protein
MFAVRYNRLWDLGGWSVVVGGPIVFSAFGASPGFPRIVGRKNSIAARLLGAAGFSGRPARPPRALDSVGICHRRGSSALRSVVLLAHCLPAMLLPPNGLDCTLESVHTQLIECVRVSANYAGLQCGRKSAPGGGLELVDARSQPSAADLGSFATFAVCAPPSDDCARSLLASCRRAWRNLDG